MAKLYSVEINLTGTTTLTNVNAGGCGSFDVDIELNPNNSNLAPELAAELNDLGIGAIFQVIYDDGVLLIQTQCTACVMASVTTGLGTENFVEGATCDTAVLTTEITLDCNDLACITFRDTTKEYDAVDNEFGYGGPNAPALGDIVGTSFLIQDLETSQVYVRSYPLSVNQDYTPNADGTSEICLVPSAFKTISVNPQSIVMVPGRQYVLGYGVYENGQSYGSATVSIVGQFMWPCCGAAIPTSLGINFSITETVGNGSIIFYDSTGAYDAVNNPQGYGGPNPDYSDIGSTLITITLEDGTEIEITDFIPTSATANYIEITAADLGYSTGNIPDQIISITYNVYNDSTCSIGYKANAILLYGNSQACLNTQITSLLTGNCECNDDDAARTQALVTMQVELDTIIAAANGNIGCIEGAIQAFYNKCNAGCSNC